jgi:hypothetical protein
LESTDARTTESADHPQGDPQREHDHRRLELQKDAQVAEHSHHNEQITMVERGALKFSIDGGHKVVRGGETLVIPPDVPHGVSGAGRYRGIRRFRALARRLAPLAMKSAQRGFQRSFTGDVIRGDGSCPSEWA